MGKTVAGFVSRLRGNVLLQNNVLPQDVVPSTAGREVGYPALCSCHAERAYVAGDVEIEFSKMYRIGRLVAFATPLRWTSIRQTYVSVLPVGVVSLPLSFRLRFQT
jgi:hypothetical protein